MTTESRRIAVLIDGDNAQASIIEEILAEAAKHGAVTTRRVYGDWAGSTMKSWKDVLNLHALQPVQQFNTVKGKNSTDIALIVDAMDILHGGSVQGFCIVSSDSDFTRLATRIRQQGLFAMGIGRDNTPDAFKSACDIFVVTETLAPGEKAETRKEEPSSMGWIELTRQAIEATAKDNGWARMADVGTTLRRLREGFTPSDYGHKQLTQLIRSAPDRFEVGGEGTQTTVRLRG